MGTNISTKQEGDTLTVDIKWDGVNAPISTEKEDVKSTPETGTVRPQSVESEPAIPTSPVKKNPVKRRQKKVEPTPTESSPTPEAELDTAESESGALGKIASALNGKRPTVRAISKADPLPKIAPIVEPKPEAEPSTKKFSILPKVVKDQWKEEGYQDQLKDQNSSKRKSILRKMVSIATDDNPLALRAFDHYTKPKGTTESGLKLEADVAKPFTKSVVESKSIEPIVNSIKETAVAKDSKKDDTVPLLDKIFNKLDEIKSAIVKTGEVSTKKLKDTVFKSATKLKTATSTVGKPPRVIRANAPIDKFAKARTQYNRKPAPAIRGMVGALSKSPAPAMMALAKPKESVPLAQLKSPVADSVANAAKTEASSGLGIMDVIGGAVAGQSAKGLAGRLLPYAARLALPAAAGYGGYKAGEWLNEKMDGTVAGDVRDSAGQSAIAMLDKVTGGMLSPNKEIADELYKETDVGKLTTAVGDKFSKAKGDTVESLTGLYGKSKNAATNITQTVPSLIDELDTQGIAPTVKQKAMVLGQLAHETGGFSKMEEGKYSADSVWKLRGPQLEKFGVTRDQLKAEEKSKGKDAMYEYMYGDKYRTGSSRLGNDQEGDAAKYKGRGLTQLTGKSNYARMSKDLGIDLVKDPDLVVKDPKVNAKVAAKYIKDNKIVRQGLATGDVDKVSQGINGGTYGKANGAADRILQTKRIEAKLEKSIDSTSHSPQLEMQAIKAANRNEQAVAPVIINSGGGSDNSIVASNQQPAPAIMARNPDSSIQRITEGQMSYGIA